MKEPLSTGFLHHGGWRLLCWILVALAFLWPILKDPYGLPTHHDCHYFVFHDEAAYLTYRAYHQFPSWNPYYCGGIAGIANPQTSVAGPTMLLKLLWGPQVGLHLGFFLLMVLGMEGVYRYAMHLGTQGAGAVFAACAWAVSGRFAAIFAECQHPVVSTWLIPWVFLGFERGLRSSRWSAVGGIVLGIILMEGGGILQVPLGVVVLFVLMIVLIADALVFKRPYRWHAPVRSFAILGAFAIGICAVRLIPAIELILSHRRVWYRREAYSIQHLLQMLFMRTNDSGYWGPGTAYVGILTLVLAAVALLLVKRAAWLHFVAFLIVLALSTGHGGVLGLYDLLQKVPIYRDLRNSFRYTFFLALFVALLGGTGLMIIEQIVQRLSGGARNYLAERFRIKRLATITYLVATLVPMTLVLLLGYWGFKDVFDGTRHRMKSIQVLPSAQFVQGPFRQSLGDRWDAHTWPWLNMGSINCFEETPFPTSTLLRGDLPQEEYPMDPAVARVQRISWSPNKIVLDVDANTNTTLLVNQNWHRAWTSDVGTVRSHLGLLAVDVPQGHYRLTMTFSDPLVTLGGLISMGTAGLLLLMLVRRRHRRRFV